jgi:hypothetical protein
MACPRIIRRLYRVRFVPDEQDVRNPDCGLVLAMTSCKSLRRRSRGKGTAPSGNTRFAGTMATPAPSPQRHHQGRRRVQRSATQFDFPVGQAVKMDVTVEGPAGACLSVSYLRPTAATSTA